MKATCHKAITKRVLDIYCEFRQDPFAVQLKRHQWAVGAGARDADMSPVFTRAKYWHFFKENERLVPFKGKLLGFPITYYPTSDYVVKDLVEQLKIQIASGYSEDLFLEVGRLLHHTQDMSTPAHVVPVFHGPIIDIEEGAENVKDNFEEFSVHTIERVLPGIAVTTELFDELTKDDGRDLFGNYITSARNSLTALYEGTMSRVACTIDGAAGEIGLDSLWTKNNPALNDDESKHGFGHYGQFGNRFGEEEISVKQRRYKITAEVYMRIYTHLIEKMMQDSIRALSIIERMATA